MRSMTCVRRGWISMNPCRGLGDLEDLGLGLVEQLPDILAHAVQGAVGDLGRDLDEFPQDRALPHDLGVAPHVVRRRRVAGKGREVGHAAGLVLVLAYLIASSTVTTS